MIKRFEDAIISLRACEQLNPPESMQKGVRALIANAEKALAGVVAAELYP